MDRWGQLTFTSVDLKEDGRLGGWQVKDQDPSLTDEERMLLSEQLIGTLDTVEEIPRFVRPEDLSALPRKLVVAPLQGALALWHTAPAGPDATGRPGNVFVHAMIDRRDPTGKHADRPIEMWRSSAWLTPFGQADVREATLPDGGSIGPGDSADRRAALDHIFDPHQPHRPGVLSVLADALHRVMAGEGTVVLGVPSPDDAALWISALGQMCAAATIRSVTWSTFERVRDDGDLTAMLGLDLACVPQRDLAAIPAGAPVVVLDADEDLLPVQWGDVPTLTRRGDEVPVTAWGSLIAGATYSRDNAEAVLAECDTLLAGLTSHADLPFELPLAMVERTTDLVPGVGEASRTVLEFAPAGVLRQTPELLRTVVALVDDELGKTTAEAWEVVQRNATRELAVELRTRALGVYLERAVQDLTWLLDESAHTRSVNDQEAAASIDPEPLVDRLVDVSASDSTPASSGREQIILKGADVLLASGIVLTDELVRHLLAPIVRRLRTLEASGRTARAAEPDLPEKLLELIAAAAPATREVLTRTLRDHVTEEPAAVFPWLPRGLTRTLTGARRGAADDPVHQDDVLWSVGESRDGFDRSAVIEVVASLPAGTRVAPWVLESLRAQRSWSCVEATALRDSPLFLEAAQDALWRDSTTEDARILADHYLREVGFVGDRLRGPVSGLPLPTRLALCTLLRPVRVHEDPRTTGTAAGNYLSCLTGLLRAVEPPDVAGHRVDALRAVALDVVYGDCSGLRTLSATSRDWLLDLVDDPRVISAVGGLGPDNEPSERVVKDGALLAFRASDYASERERDRVQQRRYWLNDLRAPISGASPVEVVTLRELEALARPAQLRVRRAITAELQGASADPRRRDEVARWWRTTYGSCGDEGIGQRLVGRLPFGRRRTDDTEATPL